MDLVKFISVSLLSMALVGCVDWVEGTDDLRKFVTEAKAKPGGRIEPLPEFKPYHSFVYEGASMREPFIPLVAFEVEDIVEEETDGSNGVQPDLGREKDFLETFALDELKMVGSISQRQGEGLWALIKDTNSEIHRVTVGNYMGLDHGEIISLDERRIELIEIVTNGRGGWMKRSRSLALDEQE